MTNKVKLTFQLIARQIFCVQFCVFTYLSSRKSIKDVFLFVGKQRGNYSKIALGNRDNFMPSYRYICMYITCDITPLKIAL